MNKERVEELLKQAGFSDREVEEGLVNLLSNWPIPTLKICSHSEKQITKMWLEIMDKKESLVKQVIVATYQCLLLGEVLGVKRFFNEPDIESCSWKHGEEKFEVAVYKRIGGQKGDWRWLKIALVQKPATDNFSKSGDEVKCVEIEGEELAEVNRVANFIKLLVDD